MKRNYLYLQMFCLGVIKIPLVVNEKQKLFVHFYLIVLLSYLPPEKLRIPATPSVMGISGKRTCSHNLGKYFLDDNS